MKNLRLFFCVVLACCSIKLVAQLPNVDIRISPLESDRLVYQEVSPPYKGGSPTAQVSVFMVFINREPVPVKITKIRFKCTQVDKTFEVPERGGSKMPNPIPAGKNSFWQNGRPYNAMGDVFQLTPPYPSFITIWVYFEGYDEPYTTTKNLVPYQGEALQFPGRAEDLDVAEYWSGRSLHGSNSGNVFGLDLGVSGWDGKAWNERYPGTDHSKNENYRIFGKPVYAMADGTVTGFKNTHPNNAKPGEKASTSPASGNNFLIDHGDFRVQYGHFQKGSLNPKLTKKGTKVKKGDFLGLAGNSGNSSAPHLHLHIVQKKNSINWRDTRPLRLYGADVVANANMPSPTQTSNWIALSNNTIPAVHSLIRPTAGLDWREYSRIAVRGAYFQGEFDKMARAGYYPAWLNGYEIGNTTYYNVIFQPAKGRQWAARYGINGQEFQKEFDKYTKAAYRLVHVDSYLIAGQERYTAVYVKRSGPAYKVYHGIDAATHQSRFEAWTKAGWTPTHVSVVHIAGSHRFTAIYEKKNVRGLVHHGALTATAYQAKYEEMKKLGLQPVYLDAYTERGVPKFSAIWYGKPPFSGHVASHGRNWSAFTQDFKKNTEAKYYSRCLVGYPSGYRAYYAGIWAKDKQIRLQKTTGFSRAGRN